MNSGESDLGRVIMWPHGAASALLRVIATLVLLLCVAGTAGAGERRVAFVVGNSAYTNVPALPNPRHDAETVAAALRQSGFEVITSFDLKQAEFDSEFQRFIRSLADSDVSLFYYSGHGIQVGGDNRIIPVDAQLKSAQDLEVQTISLRTIISYMQANSRSQIIYLDSCRNNPFPSTKFLVGPDKEISLTTAGLAPEEASLGSLIAFSTQPGNVAADGIGATSPFTGSVIKQSFVLGVDVQTALMKVTQDVWEATQHKQRPWWSSTLTEPVFLAQPTVMIASEDAATSLSNQPKPSIVVQSDDQTADGTAAQGSGTPSEAEQVAGILESALHEPRPVPIGVGAVAMLDNLPVLRGSSGAQIEIARVPGSGVLYLDSKILTKGSVIDQASLAKVSFEPSIGSDGHLDSFEFVVAGQDTSPTSVQGKIEPFLDACDTEAGEPLDLQGVSAGKLPNEINADKALAACTAAIAKYPSIARYQYELGRAKLAAGDLAGAIESFNAVAKVGYVRAYYQLGHIAERGQGRPQDLDEANRLYKLGADKGDPYAMLAYGSNQVQGRGLAADPEAGTKLLNRAVELGHTYAMNALGAMYYYGRGVKQNFSRGVRFYEAALARNDIYAMNNMGLAYLQGHGVQKDPKTAMALFKRASEGGHPSAPTNIGIMYFNGQGVKKDLDEAARWYAKGAERGDTWGASNLAWLYTNGPKALRNTDKAVWYSALAKATDVNAENTNAGIELKTLPAESKARAIKRLIGELGAQDVETSSDLDQTLVLLSRKLWQKQNPRYDLF